MCADIHDGREQTFPSKGRIQMRKTNNLQIIKSALQRTGDVCFHSKSDRDSDMPARRNVPFSTKVRRSKSAYAVTSSAVVSSDCGAPQCRVPMRS